MAGKNVLDQYANMAFASVTESGANTLTFKKIETGISFDRQIALILNRIEYLPDAPLAALFNGDGDHQDWGLSIYNTFTGPSISDVGIIDYNTRERTDYGTAAVAAILDSPIVKDFSSLPGGGIIISPAPLYMWLKGTGLAAASAVYARMYYTILELDGATALELFQARRAIIS